MVVEQKLRVLLDTNIYDFLVHPKFKKLVEKLLIEDNILVYGADVIRKELRATPKEIRQFNKSVRMALLNVYDSLTGKHSLHSSELATFLATEYFNALGERAKQNVLFKDFLIVAMASLSGLDIVCSEDNKTLKAPFALKAYQTVNGKNGLKTPKFISFKEFEKLV